MSTNNLSSHDRIRSLIAPYRVKPGSGIDLRKDFDPGHVAKRITRADGPALQEEGIALLSRHQARLAAEAKHGLLVVLQARDAAGKDGTIKHVMSGVNPQGVEVRTFKSPSTEELAHDYLWRCNRALPRRGQIGIFNRSHYEDVLVVRVHPEFLSGDKPGRALWRRRFREINEWERYLADNGTHIVKIFLNVSQEEQRKRFLERLNDPAKNWKFSAADVAERKLWDRYDEAYQDVLNNTSTAHAPWYVVPADHKWFSHVVSAAVIIDALIKIDPQYPTVSAERRLALEAEVSALRA